MSNKILHLNGQTNTHTHAHTHVYTHKHKKWWGVIFSSNFDDADDDNENDNDDDDNNNNKKVQTDRNIPNNKPDIIKGKGKVIPLQARCGPEGG